MGEITKIGWTHATWNPWHGCTKVSPGCAHCYMFRDKRRYGQDPELIQRSKTKFTEPLKWSEPRRIFTCSWSDWFHPTADAWRAAAWAIIRSTPHHTYQILTKRPERIAAHLPHDWGEGYPNVWLGTSVENQRWAHRVIPLLSVPAAVHFVSAEPLLGPVSLENIDAPWPAGSEIGSRSRGFNELDLVDALNGAAFHHDGREGHFEYAMKHRIGWVIVGGESGSDDERRDMRVEHLASLVQQCDRAGVPVFVKQDSGPKDSMQGRIPDHLWVRKEFPRVGVPAA